MPKTLFRPYIVCVIAALCYLLYVWVAYGTPLAWVTLGELAQDEGLFVYSTEGYDGQFTYFIARNPTGAAANLDVPAYRYQRILLPALGWLLSGGQAGALPFVLVGINLVGLGVGVWALEQLLAYYRVSRWYALGYGLSLGVLGTVRLALPEAIAYGLCALALWMIVTRHSVIGAATLFALAALSKETTLIVSAAVGFHLLLTALRERENILRPFVFGGIVLVPFIVWQLILWQWLGTPGIGSGGAGATSFEWIPFMGVLRILTEGGIAPFALFMAMLLPTIVLPVCWGLWRGVQDARAGNWTLYTSLLLFNAAIMLFVPFSTYREPVGIFRFIVGLQLAIILYAAERAPAQQRTLRYTTFYALTSLIVVMSDVYGPPT